MMPETNNPETTPPETTETVIANELGQGGDAPPVEPQREARGPRNDRGPRQGGAPADGGQQAAAGADAGAKAPAAKRVVRKAATPGDAKGE